MKSFENKEIIKININDYKYPKKLKIINNPPKALYCIGNIELLNDYGIAIVGARKCSDYGAKVTINFSEKLSEYGLTIISGMAIGIDTMAHKGALKNNGKTIAVLPSGFNNIYPPQNKELFKQILKRGGLIVTEYENNQKVKSELFISRNRIVSGLSLGTLLIEGGNRSGASITARLTRGNEKPLFCIPSNIDSHLSITPNNWIKKGALLVTEVEDIIKEYDKLGFKFKREIKNQKENIDVQSVTEELKDIYKLIKLTPKHIDDIAKSLKIDTQEAAYKLFILEMEGKIIGLPGKFYKKREDF